MVFKWITLDLVRFYMDLFGFAIDLGWIWDGSGINLKGFGIDLGWIDLG